MPIRKSICVVSALLLCSVQAYAAKEANIAKNVGKPMPELGPSVTFDKTDPSVRLADLRGKTVLVLFFQSWCPICNGWSPELLKSTEASLADKPGIVLVAIKTDGGGPAGAKKYLSSHGANPDKWIVGADASASYYKRVTGANELWNYALVDPAGNIAKIEEAGMFHERPGGKTFIMSTLSPGTGKSILPADKKYPAELAPAVRMAELGQFRLALDLCKKFGAQASVKESAKGLETDLLDVLKTRVGQWAETLKGSEPAGRYDAFNNLQRVAAELPATEAGKSAKAALAEVKNDPLIKKEQAAEQAYKSVMAKVATLTEQQLKQEKQALIAALKQVADKNPGTLYGSYALAEADGFSAPDSTK